MSDRFSLSFDAYAGDVEPLEFTGRESVNRPYRFDVRLSRPTAEVETFRREALETPTASPPSSRWNRATKRR